MWVTFLTIYMKYKFLYIVRNMSFDENVMVAQVGDDEFGYMLVDVLKENQVETRGCRFDANARTALAFVTLRSDGEREFMFYRNPSADMLFEPRELDVDLLQRVVFSSLFFSSCSCIFDIEW